MRSVSVAETDALVSITSLTCGSSNADHAAASANLASLLLERAERRQVGVILGSGLQIAVQLRGGIVECGDSDEVRAGRDARAQAGHRDDADQDARP